MGKLLNSFLISGIVQIGLILFYSQGVNYTPILNLFLNPSGVLGGSYWLSFIMSGLGIFGLAGLVVGTLVIKQDWLVRLSMFATLFSWVIYPLFGLWNAVGGQITAVSGGTCVGSVCSQLATTTGVSGFGAIIAGIIVGPLLVYCLWGTLEWIWSGDR